MSLFWKSSSSTPEPVEMSAEPVVQSSASETSKRTAEEIARQWFEEKTGATMPEEVKTWFKGLAKVEAQKIKISSTLLDGQQLLKIKEARRLCETKFENLEQSLERIREQLEWLRRFTKLNAQQEECRNNLVEANRKYALLMDKAQELERFEAFESVQGNFQRLFLLSQELQDNKTLQATIHKDIQALQKQHADLQKEVEQMQVQYKEQERQYFSMQDSFADGNRIKGAMSILTITQSATEDRLNSLKLEQTALAKELEELCLSIERMTAALAEKRFARQTLDAHQTMLENGEIIQLRLDDLLDAKHRCEYLNQRLEQLMRQQHEEDTLLNKLFLQHQDLDAELRVLQDELHVHRQSNHGQDSYSLQKRAMELEGRRQMFLSALSLWERISDGYAYLEEKSRDINRLRLRVEHAASNIERLELELKPLREICEEKKYAYTLSKSQNVIQLRADLKEGTSCSVCGATHHPYHADTLLEQSKLISEIKSDYDLLVAELKSKEIALAQLHIEHAAESGRLQIEREAFARSKQVHEFNVREWSQYSDLDRSFRDCSASTNMEARAIMLNQLIDKVGQDAEQAHKELDTFNFHQGRINSVNELIAQKETEKNNLVVRLNEVNTACQVMAGQVDQQQKRVAKAKEKYSRIFELLDKLINLPEWHSEWKESPENFKIRIQQQIDTWKALNEDIRQDERMLAEKEIRQISLAEALNMQKQYVTSLQDGLEGTINVLEQNRNAFHKMFGDKEVQDVQKEKYQMVLEIYEQLQKKTKECLAVQHEWDDLKGRQMATQSMAEVLEQRIAQERSDLDLWIRQFNATHPPVQYAELERVFSACNDWGMLREQIREAKFGAALAQAKVDEVRSALLAHQTDLARPSSRDGAGTHTALITQKDELEKKRREILLQMAAYDARLEEHERATEQLRALQQALEEHATL